MRIGGSLFLIAVGAILKWAVTERVHGVNLPTIGMILMVVGVVGLLLSIALTATRRRTDVIQQTGPAYVDQPGVVGQTTRTRYVQPSTYDPNL
jgi:hypothetical protein